MTPPIRIAVAGLGYWGPNLVRVLHDTPEAEVAAICDVDDGRLKKVARRYPGLRAVSDYEELVLDPSVDAVVVATSVSTHYPLALAALEAGKHVFVEKPMASSVAEAEHLRAVAAANGVLVMPGHTFLYSPSVDLVRDLIHAGDLGDIYFISMSRVNLGIHQSDVSVIWDLGPHDFSILRYWLEEDAEYVSAVTRSCIVEGVPDVAFVNLQFPQSTLAHVELSWLAPSKLRRTTVVGSQKMVVYDDTSTEPVRIFDSGADLPDSTGFGQFRMAYRTGDIISPRVSAEEPLALEVTDFCRAIATGTTPRSSVDVGVSVIRTIDAVERSIASVESAAVEVLVDGAATG